MRQARKFIFLTISLVALSSLLVPAAGRQARSKGRGKVGKMIKEMDLIYEVYKKGESQEVKPRKTERDRQKSRTG